MLDVASVRFNAAAMLIVYTFGRARRAVFPSFLNAKLSHVLAEATYCWKDMRMESILLSNSWKEEQMSIFSQILKFVSSN